MGFRGFFVLIWLAFAAACGAEATTDDVGASADIERVIRFVPDEPQSLLPGETLDFVIRCVDGDGEPVEGAEIDLALLGNAPGASLSSTAPVTNHLGVARASLRVGSDASMFRVRASTTGADEALLVVTVAKVAFRAVNVDAQYQGLRELSTRTVTARPNVACGVALADRMPGQVNQTITAPRTTVTLRLDPGVPYAIVAWGRDAAGGLLARGCAETTSIIGEEEGEEPDSLPVELIDHPLTLLQPESGPFQVELEFDVSESSARLGAAARDAGLAKLPKTTEPDADALLDAVVNELRAGVGEAAAQDVVTLRKDPAVAASLGEALRVEPPVGPSAVLKALDELLSKGAERLVAEASFAVDTNTNLQLQVSALYGSRAGGLPLPLSAALLASNRVTFAATFDEPRAQVAVSELGLTIARSAYGLAVFDALEMSNPEGVLSLLASSQGCKVLSTWAMSRPLIATSCDAACLQRACNALGKSLLTAAREGIAAPSGHTGLTIHGSVWVADRDDNNQIDALGSPSLNDLTTLDGTWHGDSAAPLDADTIRAELRMAPPPLAP